MACENPSWGEERVANELLLKFGMRVSPRTIRKYMPKLPTAPFGGPRGDQRWAVFLRNHARLIIAGDSCVVVTAAFRILYVFVVMEHASRRLIHLNVTAHPTAARTLKQLRETIPSDHEYRFIIHDHDAIFFAEFDASLTRLGLKVITTPMRSPQANSLCERLIGTLRRACLDCIIPLSEGHLRKILASWMVHYNRGRPHSSWDRAFSSRGWATCESNPADTAFRSVIKSWPRRSWADCITNTACRGLRRDAPEEQCWWEDCVAGHVAFGAATDPVSPLVRSAQPYLPGLRLESEWQGRK